MNIAQMTLLSICHEMNVKGTMSGKQRIFNLDGTPCDILGHLLLRLGYRGAVRTIAHDPAKPVRTGHTGHWTVTQSTAIFPDGREENAYTVASRELNLPETVLIWQEIDRRESTNETIRQKVKEVCGLP